MKTLILTKLLPKDRLHTPPFDNLRELQRPSIILWLFPMILFSLSSCVKQHGCDACEKGTLIIFNENNENEKDHYQYSDKIQAKFILEGDSSYYGIGILGTIPQIYKKKDTSYV